jgi:long-chain fatty acid transport protein
MLAAPPAMAAGFWLYEMGTPDLGTASAGRAALAKDAATVFGNPAGMTKLDGSQVLIGTQLAIGDVHFDRGPGTTVAGGNGGNASGLAPGGSLYFSQSLTQDFKLGFWSGSYFAGSLQYEDRWSGRYFNTKSELVTLGAGINGAYKVTDWLSIGGGPFVLTATSTRGRPSTTLWTAGRTAASSSRIPSPASAVWLGSCSSPGTAAASA